MAKSSERGMAEPSVRTLEAPSLDAVQSILRKRFEVNYEKRSTPRPGRSWFVDHMHLMVAGTLAVGGVGKFKPRKPADKISQK